MAPTSDLNVLAVIKGRDRYIFLYDDAHKSDLLRTLGRFACDPELSFSWRDAAMLANKAMKGTATQ